MLTGSELGAAIESARKKKGVTKRALALAFGVSPPSVQDWVKRGTIDKDKLSKLWTYFSDVAGPEHWGLEAWTDAQHLPKGLQSHTVAHDLIHHGIDSSPIASSRVPVIGTLAMGAENMFELRSDPSGKPLGMVSVPFASADSFAFQVFGDELYPAIRHGACLVVSPNSPATPGELVLVETLDGYYIICEFVADHADAVIWTPAAGGSRRTTPRPQVAAVHAIVCMLPRSQVSPSTE